MTEKWRSEECSKFGILNSVLARLTQMGFTVKRYMKAVVSNFATAALDATMQCIRECVCYTNGSYTRELPGNSVMSIFLYFRFSRSGLGPEKFSVVPK